MCADFENCYQTWKEVHRFRNNGWLKNVDGFGNVHAFQKMFLLKFKIYLWIAKGDLIIQNFKECSLIRKNVPNLNKYSPT